MLKRRILVIDDSESIHKDLRRILCPEVSGRRNRLDLLEAELFGPAPSQETSSDEAFEVDSAFQGQEGVDKVREALASGHPYALVFLDYRMPPGWDGFETLRHLRKLAPAMPVVLCSAFSDYSWEEITREFGVGKHLLELPKPFNMQEVHQLVSSLARA